MSANRRRRPRSRVYHRGPARVVANLTPMIDISFLLIVFFVLVSQFGDRDSIPLRLPTPVDPASTPPDQSGRTVISLVPQSDDASVIASIHTAGRDFAPDRAGREELSQHLASLYRSTPELRLNVRADRRLQYRYVEPVLRAVADGAAQAGTTPRVNLAIVRE